MGESRFKGDGAVADVLSMEPFEVTHDPYRRCEEQCNHDLARGVLVADLLAGDGPHPPSHLIVNFTLERAFVLDEGDQRAAS